MILIYNQPLYHEAYPGLPAWLQLNKGRLFITEQVRNVCLTGDVTIPSFVEYFPSEINPKVKAIVVDSILELFQENQRKKARPDVTALVEASYAQGRNPLIVNHPAQFLTNNMGIVAYALTDVVKADQIEKIISLNGLEHLIEIFPFAQLSLKNTE